MKHSSASRVLETELPTKLQLARWIGISNLSRSAVGRRAGVAPVDAVKNVKRVCLEH